MLFRKHRETEDTARYADFLQTKIIPNILKINGISHVELCHFVPFTMFSTKSDEEIDQRHLLQLDMYYESEEGLQRAMATFRDSYLIEEIVKAEDYSDLYLSYISTYPKSHL